MQLKKRIIHEIESLPTADLLVIQHVISALNAAKQRPVPVRGIAYLEAREALKNCGGNWAHDILREREDRI